MTDTTTFCPEWVPVLIAFIASIIVIIAALIKSKWFSKEEDEELSEKDTVVHPKARPTRSLFQSASSSNTSQVNNATDILNMNEMMDEEEYIDEPDKAEQLNPLGYQSTIGDNITTMPFDYETEPKPSDSLRSNSVAETPYTPEPYVAPSTPSYSSNRDYEPTPSHSSPSHSSHSSRSDDSWSSSSSEPSYSGSSSSSSSDSSSSSSSDSSSSSSGWD